MKKLMLFVLFGIGCVNAEEQKYFRIVEKNGVPIALETAVVSYKNKGGKTIDLIGAVHIGDKDYYDNLNVKFKAYDALLYELVAPKNTRPAKKNGDMHGFSAKILGLSTQMNNVDYSPANFVHADLSMEELIQKGKARGETMTTLALGVVADVIRSNNLAKLRGNPNFQLSFEDIFDVNKTKIKRIFASQMVNSDINAIGPTLGYYLVDIRNEAAMEVVTEQFKTKNKLGLFYGAAHLPDFHKRLLALGFEQVDVKWEVAWKID